MFHTPAWNDTATANPVSNNGQVFTATSERLSAPPKAPSASALNAVTGLWPEMLMMIPLTMAAPASATNGGSRFSMKRGISSGRSSPPDARHQQAKPLRIHRRRERGAQPAAKQHTDPIAQVQHLIEIGR